MRFEKNRGDVRSGREKTSIEHPVAVRKVLREEKGQVETEQMK
jgi:hypothetical protein